MKKYTTKQIAESDELFDKEIKKLENFTCVAIQRKLQCLKKGRLLFESDIKDFLQNIMTSTIAELAGRKMVQNTLILVIVFIVTQIIGFRKIDYKKIKSWKNIK